MIFFLLGHAACSAVRVSGISRCRLVFVNKPATNDIVHAKGLAGKKRSASRVLEARDLKAKTAKLLQRMFIATFRDYYTQY